MPSLRSNVLRSPALKVWHRAVKKLPPKSIIPTTEGDTREHKLAAFVGDKLLGASFARWVQRNGQAKNSGDATKLASLVLSNRFMADRLARILPNPAYRDWAKKTKANNQKVGTLVEAAVAAVEDVGAVDSLVAWLVSEGGDAAGAASSSSGTGESGFESSLQTKAAEGDSIILKSKAILLQLGGSVNVERGGGSDHAPIYLAKANYRDMDVEAKGRSKREAEQRAASLALQIENGGEGEDILLRFNNSPSQLDVPRSMWDPNCENEDLWTKFDFAGGQALKLRNGETITEWWQRGAKDPQRAFRRAMFGPHIFPQKILSVDSWTSRHEVCEDVHVGIVVVSSGSTGEVESPTETFTWSAVERGPSATKARKVAGLLASKEISRITGVDIDNTDTSEFVKDV